MPSHGDERDPARSPQAQGGSSPKKPTSLVLHVPLAPREAIDLRASNPLLRLLLCPSYPSSFLLPFTSLDHTSHHYITTSYPALHPPCVVTTLPFSQRHLDNNPSTGGIHHSHLLEWIFELPLNTLSPGRYHTKNCATPDTVPSHLHLHLHLHIRRDLPILGRTSYTAATLFCGAKSILDRASQAHTQ